MTQRALRRDPSHSNHFPDDVLEQQAFLGPVSLTSGSSWPGSDPNVPLWILGSSLFGTQPAAELGLPYGFASHFAPQALDTALKIYPERFKPSEQLSASYALVGMQEGFLASRATKRVSTITGMSHQRRCANDQKLSKTSFAHFGEAPQEVLATTQTLSGIMPT